MKYYINGDLVNIENATIRVDDLGLLRGFGIFDYFTVTGGRALFLADHLQRFEQSAKIMGMELPMSLDALEKELQRLFIANQTFDAGIRMVMTGGYSPDCYTPTQPNLIILQRNKILIDHKNFEQGVHLLLLEHEREIPLAKTTNYIIPIIGQKRVSATGAFDLLYHKGGNISESSRSNFFAVLPGNKIITPEKNILKGVTRKHVIQMARYNNFEIVEGQLSLDDLKKATEAFMTNSVMGVMPVVKVEDQTIGTGRPGPVCEELMECWDDYVAQTLEEA